MPVSSLFVRGNQLICGERSFICAIGKGGFSSDKREGDGATPIGTFALRECWVRADRIAPPKTGLNVREIKENDGWCDDPQHPLYNRYFRHSGEGGMTSFESLFRDDRVYDLIVPLGYNDDPVIPGRGSAIFMHVARNGYTPTEGCVALALLHLQDVLKQCNSGTKITILGDN